MSYKTPFVLPRPDARQAADAARVSMSNGSESDGFLGIRVMDMLDRMKKGKNGGGSLNSWARQNYLSIATLSMSNEIRRNIDRELLNMGFKKDSIHVDSNNIATEAIVQAVIAGGFYPNLASRTGGEVNFSTPTNRKTKIHVSSVNALKGMPLGRKSNAHRSEIELMTYLEMVKGKDIFTCQGTARLHSVLPLLLFAGMHQGGALTVRPSTMEGEDNLAILNLEDFCVYKCDREIAAAIIVMRRRICKQFDEMLLSPRDHGNNGGDNNNIVRAAKTIIQLVVEDERMKLRNGR